MVSGDECGTTLCGLVSGAVIRNVTALGASPRTTGSYELNVVVIAKASTTLRAFISANASVGVAFTEPFSGCSQEGGRYNDPLGRNHFGHVINPSSTRWPNQVPTRFEPGRGIDEGE